MRSVMVGLFLLGLAGAGALASQTRAADAPFQTALTPEDFDPEVLTQWVDGKATALATEPPRGAAHVVWTTRTMPAWDGLNFGVSNTPGPRHLGVGFKAPVAVGSVVVESGGQLSVLKPDAAFPGNLADDTAWAPAQRLCGAPALGCASSARITAEEVGREEYAIWILPPGTKTRELRFTHTAALTDNHYAGHLAGVCVLAARFANVAPQAVATASARGECAGSLNNERSDIHGAWDNGNEGATQAVSPEHPEWIMLTWPAEVQLRGLCTLWTGFGAADAQTYTGPAGRQPRDAAETDWRTVKSFDGLDSRYPLALGCNWLDFEQTIATRAIRLRITKVVAESHPHLSGNTKKGKRVWLGEVLALQGLGDKALASARVAPPPPGAGAPQAPHPPLALHFTLPEPGYVTLVIDDAQDQRVCNLVSETLFPAGQNTAWWDGSDDLQRDMEAAAHGIYHIPTRFVQPGTYRVRGLWRKSIDLRYEFAVYTGGNPAWPTEDHTGGWLTNHTPPQAAQYVPGEKGGKPLVYLGSALSEGGDGLAWVDLDGKKVGGCGWVGGAWTSAPYLACDLGPQAVPDVHLYVGAAYEGNLRLTALTKSGEKNVVKFGVPGGKDALALSGLAIRNGLLVCSLPKQKRLLLVDARAGKVLDTIMEIDDPRGLAFDAQDRLLVLAGKQLVRHVVHKLGESGRLPMAETVISAGLEDPQHVALDAQGNFYVSDRGNSHQVKVFAADGKLLRVIGHPGAPKAGPYDPEHMNNPCGLSIDSNQHLWVTEADYQPKRVSVWTLDGKLIKAFYGPGEYGGGGTLDPHDKSRLYYHGMEFKLDWQHGADRLVRVFFRPQPDELQLPDEGANGYPETAIYLEGRRYFTNCYNSNPTSGTCIACLWLDQDGIAKPVAALGCANNWSVFKGDAFKPRWPQGVDLNGNYWQNLALFAWSDLNGDGHIQPEEVAFVKGGVGGVTVMPDLSFIASRVDGKAMRYAPVAPPPPRAGAPQAPVYDLAAGEVLVEGTQYPLSSGGDQVLRHPEGWTILTIAPRPYAPASMGGAYKSAPRWSYPSLWPGLHASHESPLADRPGELTGTTRLLGGFVTPRHGEAGPLWCINGNQGNMYVFTADGLFVATLFKDFRQGAPWAMPVAQRGMLLNGVTLSGENFWPSWTQTEDGLIYLVDGARSCLVRLDGLESIRRLPESTLRIGAAELQAAQTYFVETEAQRQKRQGGGTLTVALHRGAPAPGGGGATTPGGGGPTVDGKLDASGAGSRVWAGAEWVDVDKSGVAAWFDSHSRPHNVTAALAVCGDRLYAAFRAGEPDLLKNSGEIATAPFKTGGALDLMLGTNPAAAEKRSAPVEGDLRLLVSVVKAGGAGSREKPWAVLYRAVVPGTKEPVPFSSPWRTITLDRVEDVSAQVQFAADNGNYEFSIPLALLGLHPQAGQVIQGDVGVLRGDGMTTVQRVYWSNKATGLTSDVPSEAMLTPQLWGRLRFVTAPAR